MTATRAAPTPFVRKRAAEIWAARGYQWSLDGQITAGEDAYVRQVWATMPGSTCWMQAFFRILHGEVTQP